MFTVRQVYEADDRFVRGLPPVKVYYFHEAPEGRPGVPPGTAVIKQDDGPTLIEGKAIHYTTLNDYGDFDEVAIIPIWLLSSMWPYVNFWIPLDKRGVTMVGPADSEIIKQAIRKVMDDRDPCPDE